jgi:hypothetical protein
MIPTAQVFWSVTGRFYKAGNTVFDTGYFVLINPLPFARMFSDPAQPSETTAYFTFSAEPFTTSTINNGGLALGIDDTGAFSVFYDEHPGKANFDDPTSFARGQRVATFRRTHIVAGVTAAYPAPMSSILANAFSAELVSSEPFTIADATYDFARLVPRGITQWGFAATENLIAPEKYDLVVPFVGTAIAQ